MTVKANSHFVDCDKATGTVETWQDNRYGTPSSDATQISTVAEFLAINDDAVWDAGQSVYGIDGNYELIADLDFSDVTAADGISEYSGLIGARSVPGLADTLFRGTFHGGGHTINNMDITKIKHPSFPGNGTYGLFAAVRDGTIQHLHLRNCIIRGDTIKNIGLLIGNIRSLTASGIITQCSVEGSIIGTGTNMVTAGGLCGAIGGSFSGTHAVFTRCYADVDISYDCSIGSSQIGGLLGSILKGEIVDCYCEGSITDVNKDNNSNIVGGFAGATSTSTITNCYCATPIDIKAESTNKGGFVGTAGSGATLDTFTSCYWDGTISGLSGTDASTATEKTTAQMYTEATFVDWDFDVVPIWTIDEGSDYPRLQWESLNLWPVITGTQDRTIAHPTDWSHLEGETVQVLGDGSYLGTDVVASGEIDLDDETTVNHVGLRFASKLQPMKLA